MMSDICLFLDINIPFNFKIHVFHVKTGSSAVFTQQNEMGEVGDLVGKSQA